MKGDRSNHDEENISDGDTNGDQEDEPAPEAQEKELVPTRTRSGRTIRKPKRFDDY